MSTRFDSVREQLQGAPSRWLVTGVAGFIGSHLLETLLSLRQRVVGLDNFATARRTNLEDVRRRVGEQAWQRFLLVEGDITVLQDCLRVCENVDLVLHQAALGSVPRSIEHPLATHHANVTGFANVLEAARRTGVRRLVYASSSAVYGDHPGLPKVEGEIGQALSPYAVSKHTNETYANVFARCYAMSVIGLRYFNVFGRREHPDGPYAAVIPRWSCSLLQGAPCTIFGDGESTRDFTPVANVVQANLLAATVDEGASGSVFNVACGVRTTLRELYDAIAAVLVRRGAIHVAPAPSNQGFRPGDVRHSLADISAARQQLGYEPSSSLDEALEEAAEWYANGWIAEPAEAA